MRSNYFFSSHSVSFLLKNEPLLEDKYFSPRPTNRMDDMWTKPDADVFFKSSFRQLYGEAAEINQDLIHDKKNIIIHINKKYSRLRREIVNGNLKEVIQLVPLSGLKYLINEILTDDELIELVTQEWSYSFFNNRLYRGNEDAFDLFNFLAIKMNAVEFLNLACSQPPDKHTKAFLHGLLAYDMSFTYPIFCRNNEPAPCNHNFVSYVQGLSFMIQARKNIKEYRANNPGKAIILDDIIDKTLNISVASIDVSSGNNRF